MNNRQNSERIVDKMKNDARNLVIRVDAGPRIGMGHYVRCLALAQHWCLYGGQASILTNIADERIGEAPGISFLKTLGAATNPDQLIELLKRQSAKWSVIDGECFDEVFLAKIAKTGIKILFLDDNAFLTSYPVNLLLNQNIFSAPTMYTGKTKAKLLLGENYTLLRTNLLEREIRNRKHPDVATKLLVTFGGADPLQLTESFLSNYIGLSSDNELRKISIRLVVGQMNSSFKTIKLLSKQLPNCCVLNGVTNMEDHMRWSDIALSSGGSTVWELSFYQTPMVLIPVSASEEKIARHMEVNNAAIIIKDPIKTSFQGVFERLNALIENKEHRLSLGDKAGNLIDGKGAVRVIDAMRKFTN